MSVTVEGLDRWERSIRENVGQWQIQQTMSFEVTRAGAEEQYAKLPELLQKWLLEFIRTKILGRGGILRRQFDLRANAGTEYWPQYLSQKDNTFGEQYPVGKYTVQGGSRGGRAKQAYRRNWANMESGFRRLWEAIADAPQVWLSGSTLHAGIGRVSDVAAIRLNEFMGTQGSLQTTSPLNSLFYAVEFGTGVAENVGSGFVRTSGPTKAIHPPGAWWFGSRWNDAMGLNRAFFLGQKGFHFLYDERTRQPLDLYRAFFERYFPEFVQEKLGSDITVRRGS